MEEEVGVGGLTEDVVSEEAEGLVIEGEEAEGLTDTSGALTVVVLVVVEVTLVAVVAVVEESIPVWQEGAEVPLEGEVVQPSGLVEVVEEVEERGEEEGEIEDKEVVQDEASEVKI